MSDLIIAALISGVFATAGTFAGILASNRLTCYRLGQLEKKVDMHNTLIDRTYSLEAKSNLMQLQINQLEKEKEHAESF